MSKPSAGFLQQTVQRLGSPRRAVMLMGLSALLMMAAQFVPQKRDLGEEAFLTVLAENPIRVTVADWLGLTEVYGSPVFVATLGLLALSLLLNSWQRIRKLPAQASVTLKRRSPKRLSHMKAYEAIEVPEGVEDPLAAVERAAWRNRYAVERDERNLRAVHGRFSVVGSMLFHLSMVIVAVGWLVSVLTKFHGVVLLTEGETFGGDRGQYASFSPVDLDDADLPPLAFKLADLDVVYDDADNVLDAVATVFEGEGEEQKVHEVRVNYPYRSGNTAVRLVDYGFAPVFTVLDPSQGRSQTAAFKLQLMPAGKTDQFMFPTVPRMFEVSLFPHHATDEQGRDTSLSRDLVNPKAFLRVTKPDGTVENAELTMGRRREYVGEVLVTMPEVRYYTRFEVDRDASRELVYFGLIMGFLGLMWRLFYPLWTLDAAVEEREDGKRIVHLGGAPDYVVETFARHFEHVVERIRKELAQ